MDKLDEYVKDKVNNHHSIIFKNIIEKYKVFEYDDKEDLILDLNLLLSVKYKNTKMFFSNEKKITYKLLKKKLNDITDEDKRDIIISKINKLKNYRKLV